MKIDRFTVTSPVAMIVFSLSNIALVILVVAQAIASFPFTLFREIASDEVTRSAVARQKDESALAELIRKNGGAR